MHGADEFLCRNCVILKCEAVALVRHRKNQSVSIFFLLHLRLRSIASDLVKTRLSAKSAYPGREEVVAVSPFGTAHAFRVTWSKRYVTKMD